MSMNELVGCQCAVDFALPHSDWPFSGFPAWVVVLAVDMPMVKMCSYHGGGNDQWINVSVIKSIRGGPRKTLAEWAQEGVGSKRT